MKTQNTLSILVLILSLSCIACGDDSSGGAVDRAGPQSLAGVSWKGDPVDVGGISLQLAFQFTANDVTASNTCDGATTVSTTSPVRYTYSGNVAQGDSASAEQGGNFCEISVDSGSFDFEIVDGLLMFTYKGQTIAFSPDGAVSGLYGTWTAAGDGLTLRWSFGQGVITSRADCDNGLSAEVTVAATFTNFLEVLQASSNEESGCEVSISQAKLSYRFDGDDLIMTQAGQEQRFSR